MDATRAEVCATACADLFEGDGEIMASPMGLLPTLGARLAKLTHSPDLLISERLAAYWAEALGGPTAYSDSCGDETSVVRLHSGNGPHEEMDRRAIDCFDQAMTDIGLLGNDPVRAVLHDYFAWATTTTMSRYQESADDVPEGLRIPRWSWDGPC